MKNETKLVTIKSSGSINWLGREYRPDRNGEITLPLAAVEHIEKYVYTPQNQPYGVDKGHRAQFERVPPKEQKMEPVTKGDYNDLNQRLSALEHYVDQLEERLDGQHQGLADQCQEEFGKLHERLSGQPDTLAELHKAAGSSIVDADEVEEHQVVEEIERMARGE